MSGNEEQNDQADVAALVLERDSLKVELAEATAAVMGLMDQSASVDRLSAVLAELSLQGDGGELSADVAAAALKSLNGKVLAAADEVKALQGEVEAQKAKHSKTKAKLAEVVARDPAAKARKLPKDRPVLSRDDHGDMLDLIRQAGKVEVVGFTDGVEAVAIPPLLVNAEGFKSVTAGLILSVPSWEVTGPAQVTGWALYLDGQLSAWCARPDGRALQIGAGQTFNLAGDVVF